MFGLIIIRHAGPHALPGYFRLQHRKMGLRIRITQGCSLIQLRPTLNSVGVRGVPIFQKAELDIPPDDIPVDFPTYVKQLRAFLDTFLASEYVQARSQMDVLRHLFVVNDMKSAKALIKRMPSCGDVKMLKFIADRADILLPSAEHYQVMLGQEIAAGESAPADPGAVREILEICSEVDEKTRCVFILAVQGLLPPENLPGIVGGLGITDAYVKAYIGMKTCERLVSCGLKRMAAYMLVSTALELKGGQDLMLRESLLRMALSQIPHGRWRERSLGLINGAAPTETQVPVWGRVDFPSASTKDGRRGSLSVCSQSPIFSISMLKRTHEDWCTGILRVHNRDGILIDGIFAGSSRFIPIFSSGTLLQVDLFSNCPQAELEEEGGIYLDCFILADGERVPIDRHFKIIKRSGDLVPKEIAYEDNRYIFNFEVTGSVNAVVLDSKYGAIQRAGSGLTVHLNPGTHEYTMEVELSQGLYEERSFCISK